MYATEGYLNGKWPPGHHNLNEVDGWTFMVVLKLCRERTGPDLDNWVDGAAYMALAGEAVDRQI